MNELFFWLLWGGRIVILLILSSLITIEIGGKLLYSKYPELIFLIPLLNGILIAAILFYVVLGGFKGFL